MLGIGGRTLAEAKQNLSAEEVGLWAAYRAQRGTLSVGLRLEQLFAISDLRAAQIAGVKRIKLQDLLRYHDDNNGSDNNSDRSDAPDEVAEPGDIDPILKLFGLDKAKKP